MRPLRGLQETRVATRGVTPCPRSGVAGQRRYPTPLSQRPRAAAGRSNLTTEARDGGREDQPHVQEAVAAPAGGVKVLAFRDFPPPPPPSKIALFLAVFR